MKAHVYLGMIGFHFMSSIHIVDDTVTDITSWGTHILLHYQTVDLGTIDNARSRACVPIGLKYQIAGYDRSFLFHDTGISQRQNCTVEINIW